MRNTGVILRATLRVNANGAVTLDVIQEVSGANQADKTLTSDDLAAAGAKLDRGGERQTVLLGGLIQTKDDLTQQSAFRS